MRSSVANFRLMNKRGFLRRLPLSFQLEFSSFLCWILLKLHSYSLPKKINYSVLQLKFINFSTSKLYISVINCQLIEAFILQIFFPTVFSFHIHVKFPEARVMRSCLHRNTPYIIKGRKLQESFKKRHAEMTAIKHMITINARLENRMCFAASTNHVEAVQRLLNNGVSPNCRDAMGRTPLHIAGRR